MAAMTAGVLCKCSMQAILLPTARQTTQDEWMPRHDENEAKMAYVTTTRQETISLGDRIVALFKVASQAMHRRQAYLETVTQLNELSAHELADLGIERDQIPAVAREAAYGVQDSRRSAKPVLATR